MPPMPQVKDKSQDCLQVRATGGDQRPQVELCIPWFSRNKQEVMALVDTGAEFTLVHGNPQKFSGPLSIQALQ